MSGSGESNLINQQLDNVSKEDLLDLTNEFLENPPQFKQAIVSALHRLFDDVPEFAELLNKSFERTYFDLAQETLYQPLREGAIKKQNQALSIVKRMVHMGEQPGISAGILLSWIVQEMNKAEKFMIEGLSSRDSDTQRCSLVAFSLVIRSTEIHEKDRYFEILKDIAPNVLQENITHLIICLQYAYEELPDEFESILEKEITCRGSEAAKEYIRFVHYKPRISVSILQKAVKILEHRAQESYTIYMGLAKIYEYNPDFVVERLQKRLIDKQIRLTGNLWGDGYLLHKINEIGSEPVLRMIESQIDNGNSVLLNIGESILKDFFPHFEDNVDWVAWCEKWKDDPKKEEVLLKSLGIILSKLINYKSSEVRDRAVSIVKDFAVRKGIDYEVETNEQLNLGEGKESKENTIKALYVIERILNPPVPIDIETLSENLKRAPCLSKAIDAGWLINKGASSHNPHPLAQIFHDKIPNEDGLSKYQLYWENIFKILEQHNIKIGKRKLHDIKNGWSYLAEAEVLSRLAPHFDKIVTEPCIPELNPKRLEALIEHNGEQALIEVRAVHEKWEESLSHGVISVIPGSKIKNVLRNKFEWQLKKGKVNPGIPILIILCLEGFMGFMEMADVRNAVYGALQFSYKMRDDTHEIIEEGTTREENAFYDIEGTEIVTAIGAYRRGYDKNDPLVGKLYHPHKLPTNKMSQKFKLMLRNALFGDSEISDWKSLMQVPGISGQIARLLYANGIEDLGVLASIQENEYDIDGISQENLLRLQKEAIRVISAISTGSVRFLKGINQTTFDILQNKGIYLISKILELEAPPEGISHEVWSSLKEDARRISD
jgi:hypothetical protein